MPLPEQIPAHLLSGPDMAGLMSRMAKADWYYDYADDPIAWQEGKKEVDHIIKELQELAALQDGISTAARLWLAYVPPDSIQRPAFLTDQQQSLSSINSTTMIDKNLDYLKSNIRNHGFGEELAKELEAQLSKGAAEFTLAHKTEVNKREIESTLYFKKSDKTEMYFFNKYDTRMKNEKNESLAQTFYINNGWGISLKEAYNLLNGRAVHKELTSKEGEKYQAWVQLDFSAKDKNGNYERKQYHQNYGYDLKESLAVYPIIEMMKEDNAKDLIRSLERGNLQMVTMITPDKDIRFFIEANPQYKSIGIYDNKMNRLDQDQREQLRKQESQSTVKEEKQSRNLAQEEQGGKEQKNGKKKNDSSSQGLVQKERTRKPGKGLGV